MGGDADIDNYLLSTRSNLQDLEAAVVQLKAKAVQQLFEDTFINGNATTNPKSYDGVDRLTDAGQTISMGTNGATLTLAKLDELIDLIKGGKPDLLITSKRTRRTLNSLARTSGSFLETDRNEFGQMVQFYNGIPVGVSDYISDAQTVGTSNDCSTIYAIQFGRRRRRRPHRPGRPPGRTRRLARDQGCNPRPHQVVRQSGTLQRPKTRQAHRRPAIAIRISLRVKTRSFI